MSTRMRPKLRKAVETVLQSVGVASHNLNDRRGTKNNKAARTDAVYETYIFSLMVRAIERIPSLTGRPAAQTNNAGKFCFRRGPGKLKTTPSKWSYIDFDVSGRAYELHVDTYVGAKAPQAELEMDVLIVAKDAADACRGQQKSSPKHTETRLCVEVKYLCGKYGTGLAKELLGIRDQVGSRKGHLILVTNHSSTPNAERLLRHRELEHHVAVVPTKSGNVDGFVDEMTTLLEAAL